MGLLRWCKTEPAAMCIRLRRIYETPVDSDGARILVDRRWPRGISKQEANISLWLRNIAPSTG
jgi:uncharacterized protein YeaO (DUF488 family)